MNKTNSLSITHGLTCILLAAIMSVGSAHAETVSYALDDIFLADGSQMTGAFDWTYTTGDFEGGSGVFSALEIPWRPAGSAPPLEEPDMVLTIENNQIEISLDGNFHDYGLGIIIKFVQPLSPTQSSLIDLNTSFYECCGNGFKDQPFSSGSITPIVDADGDGVADTIDNCTNVANAAQIDTDVDGHGNICDADIDQSCFTNFDDLTQMKAAFFSNDPDLDLDSSGFVNFDDLAIMKNMFFTAPGPSAAGLCN